MRQSLDGYRLEKINGVGMWSKELEEQISLRKIFPLSCFVSAVQGALIH